MIFILIGRDYEDALDRRMAVRAQHLERLQKAKDEGKVIFFSAFKDEVDGHLNGGITVFDIESREELDQFLLDEPYIKNNVWETIEVIEGALSPSK